MNPYVTGTVIKGLREGKGLTQAQLAARLQVSDKAVSKWETAKGYPDITLIEPLAQALDISVMELLSGDCVTNANRAGNLLRAKWYVCPICGNIIHSTGAAVLSCCGLTLPPLEPEAPDEDHAITLEPVEDEVYVTLNHPMEKGALHLLPGRGVRRRGPADQALPRREPGSPAEAATDEVGLRLLQPPRAVPVHPALTPKIRQIPLTNPGFSV